MTAAVAERAQTAAPAVRCSVVNVTPEFAADALSRNTNNRTLRRAVVDAYARDMAAGNWQMTGEPIMFAADGTLLNGQHRLAAVVKNGQPIQLLVVDGLARTSQDSMDSGVKRTAADALQLNGFKNTTVLAAVANLALAIEHNDRRRAAMTHAEILDWITGNPDVLTATEKAVKYCRLVGMTTAPLGYSWLTFSRIDAEACFHFFDDMANMSTAGFGDPRFALLQRLRSANARNEKLTSEVLVSMTFRAWNHWRKGQKLTSIPAASRQGRISIPKAV